MTSRNTLFISASTGLPAAACMSFYLAAPETVAHAVADCVYADEAYSSGANISDSCTSGKVQTCGANGSWNACHAAE